LTLERHTIEKRDFPVARRGYDPGAVDAHLSAIADEVEALRGGAASEPVAVTISEQVRGIVEAAEKGANEIHARAQQEARQIRSEATRAAKRERQHADRDAKQQREQAAQQAREYVEKVSQAASQMLERLEAIDGELGGLTASLRAGTERLNDELGAIESELESLSEATASGIEPVEDDEWEVVSAAPAAEVGGPEPPPVATEPAPALEGFAPAAESGKVGDTPPEATVESEPESVFDAPAVLPTPEQDFEPGQEEPATGGGGDESEAARLIALNMALNGTPRHETDRYLEENFRLDNRASLLDEVYASIEG
jgi:DivIVA domain-containing protein